MTRHPTARRVHREHAGPDDVFVGQVLETSVWAREHSRTLLIGGIAAVVLIVFGLWYVSSRRSLSERASTELTPLRALVQSGNTQAAIPQLEQYLARFGGAPVADEARLMLAQSYLASNQAPQALETLEDVDDDPENPMGVNALMLRAAAYETTQAPHRAEEIFLRIADEAPHLFQKQDALDNAARIRMASNNPAGAAELYERALELTPEAHPARGVFELRLGEARAAATAGGAGPGAPAAAPAAPAPAPTTTGS